MDSQQRRGGRWGGRRGGRCLNSNRNGIRLNRREDDRAGHRFSGNRGRRGRGRGSGSHIVCGKEITNPGSSGNVVGFGSRRHEEITRNGTHDQRQIQLHLGVHLRTDPAWRDGAVAIPQRNRDLTRLQLPEQCLGIDKERRIRHAPRVPGVPAESLRQFREKRTQRYRNSSRTVGVVRIRSHS